MSDPVIEARLGGYDRAVERLQDIANSQPTPGTVNERLIALKEIVETRFRELDVRTNAVAASDKKAIDLALQAAKEAAAKSEDAFNKQISSLEARITDIKDRVVGMEAGALGSRQGYAGIGTAISLAAAVIGAVVAIVLVISRVAT